MARGRAALRHLASASDIEGDRGLAVSERGGDEQSAPPSTRARCSGTGKYISSATACRYVGLIAASGSLAILATLAALPAFSLEKALEVDLVLAHRRRVELGFDRGAKARVGEREGKTPRQPLARVALADVGG